jgi:large repetitive protein
VTVTARPLPQLQWTPGSCDSTVTFTATATAVAPVVSYIFSYGDLSADTLMAPDSVAIHKYLLPGTYTATLTVIDANGCDASVEASVARTPCLAAQYAWDDTLCQGYAVPFRDMSSCDGVIAQWLWSWGDGTPDTAYSSYLPLVTHVFNAAGDYAVSLRVTTVVNGITVADSTLRTVSVRPAPQGDFVASNVCLGEEVHFSDASIPGGAPITAWRWDFADPLSTGDTSSLQNPLHAYPSTGTYPVSLVVQNTFGCKDTLVKDVTVNGLPAAAFDNSLACMGHPAYFFDHSRPFAAPLTQWGWILRSDRFLGTMNGPGPSFVFDSTGTVMIMLTVADSNGCIDSVVRQLTVNPVPLSAFSFTPDYQQVQGQVLFSNGSLNALRYYWDFGNGITSTATSPMVVFSDDGWYTVQLVAVNDQGCADTASMLYRMMFKGLWIPNAMAPSGPVEETRLWKPVGVNLASYKAEVYNSFGALLWSSTALDTNGVPTEGWDGTYKEAPCQQDVYVWKIQAVFRDGTIWRNEDVGKNDKMGDAVYGTITLIR